MKIKIIITDNDDNVLERTECLSFESAEEMLGKMERRHEQAIDNEVDELLMDELESKS